MQALKKFTFLKSLFLIGGKLLYNIVLVSAVQQHESAISICISPPSGTSLATPHSSLLSAKLGSICYTAVSSYFTHGGIYMSMLLFQFVSLFFP